ncbi:MAG: rhodanese-like domain-containing protein [Saprospiraceae bacterium]|nr:rhodanese-like domain-containing protein [Saprospiraceae bacterium]
MELNATLFQAPRGLGEKAKIDRRFVILDVRTIQEFVGDHVLGALNIPYDEIQIHINKIKSWNKPILTYSDDGRRSQKASFTLNQLGVKAIDGGNITKVKALLGQL